MTARWWRPVAHCRLLIDPQKNAFAMGPGLVCMPPSFDTLAAPTPSCEWERVNHRASPEWRRCSKFSAPIIHHPGRRGLCAMPPHSDSITIAAPSVSLGTPPPPATAHHRPLTRPSIEHLSNPCPSPLARARSELRRPSRGPGARVPASAGPRARIDHFRAPSRLDSLPQKKKKITAPAKSVSWPAPFVGPARGGLAKLPFGNSGPGIGRAGGVGTSFACVLSKGKQLVALAWTPAAES